MRYGIPIVGNRVAPRCTCAESVLTIVSRSKDVRRESEVPLANESLASLIDVLTDCRVDTLVCGGISRESRDRLRSHHIDIVDNVAGTVADLLAAVKNGELRAGFGLSSTGTQTTSLNGSCPDPMDHVDPDCLACSDRMCLRGERCRLAEGLEMPLDADPEIVRMLDASLDISSERERTLCRLSELVYFCLEMRYQRLGLAYCEELREPADILARVLRRFFDVIPVSCKIAGVVLADPTLSGKTAEDDSHRRSVACNPLGQASYLNSMGTDLNVLVGTCIGADCIFSQSSNAPVSTLFVKDRSLANNPIGAIYSDYYLHEATRTTARSAHRAV